jgi:pyruvate,orthophosphate dikinase
MAAASPVLWVDIRELIRTWYGYPSALSFGDDVFESYVADGHLAHNPRTSLGTNLKETLGRLMAAARSSPGLNLGVDCGEGAAMSLVNDLYEVGFRTFSVPLQSSASVRLALGQLAARTAHKAHKEA